MEPNKTFKVDNKQIILYFVLGAVTILTGFMGNYLGYAAGILFIIVGALLVGKNYASFYSDYVSFKPSPIAGAKLIKYNEIENFEIISDKKIFIHGIINGKKSKLRIAIFLIKKEERQDFINYMNSKIGK
ncbi:MAG: hypothetical protein IPO21_05700 [Bacteroidales bacterium]|nr:hypothetical protein [Bacteroidales bacterium]